jgi:replicative DNA helicase
MLQQENVSFSSFGRAFQEKLAQLILSNRGFSDQIEEVIDVNFFELRFLQIFASKVFNYKREYQTHPSFDAIETILKKDIEQESDLLKEQIRTFLEKISKSHSVSDEDFIKSNALDFCKKQKLKEAMVKSIDLLQRCSFGEISEVINGALKLGLDNDFGYDYVRDFEKRFEIKSRKPVPTGWEEINRLIDGGLGRGELGVVIAPTGVGKSMALAHMGASAVKSGYTVVHYTLELMDIAIASRYDSCITGYSLSSLKYNKEMIYDIVKGVEGTLIVKEYPTKSATTATIRNHLEKLIQRGTKPDLVIVDYADLLRPVSYQKEKRNELESIYEELRALGQLFECPFWTASQTNRSGLNAEVITMESISEAFNKCFVADFIFSLSRTPEDKKAKTGRVFIAKNRNGEDGITCPIFMDTSQVSIKVFPPTNDTLEDIANSAMKRQKEKTMDIMKTHHKNQKSLKRKELG